MSSANPRGAGKGRQRLDVVCVERGLAPTRQRAQALILAGTVAVEGQVVTKAGTPVSADADVVVRGDPLPYVSRGGLKLAAALDHFELSCAGHVALDVGASTGGFTDCLLQRDARHVIAIDVGYGQLAWKLRQDSRVTLLERTNARQLAAQQLRAALADGSLWPPTLAVLDVSFISLLLVLPSAAACLAPGSPMVALVKPQFEVGRHEVGKGGVVRDASARRRAIDRVMSWAREQNYVVEEVSIALCLGHAATWSFCCCCALQPAIKRRTRKS